MGESEFRVDHYGSEETLRLREPIIGTYLASHHDQQHNPWFGPDQFWRRLVELYAPSRDFRLVAAWLGETMVGYAFGSPKENSTDVWEMVRKNLPEVKIPDNQVPIYFFREFAVHPGYQGHGYGHRLHDALLKSRPEPLAHLLVRTDNPAKTSYLHWGWHAVGKVQPFQDSPKMDAMVHILPLSLRCVLPSSLGLTATISPLTSPARHPRWPDRGVDAPIGHESAVGASGGLR
jgi:GNAT superfamily N-acetyltransferase